MNMKFFFLLFFIPQIVFAFTLNNNFSAAFDKSKVNVFIDRNTTCALAGITVYDLEDVIKKGIGKFWNIVPTSNLRLKFGGFSDTVSNINSVTGRLCAPTDDDCIKAAGANVIPPVNEIIVACNANQTNFVDSNVLAVTVPNHFSGKKIRGAVILINNFSNDFAQLSHDGKVAVLAHEIGHALGLGHSENKSALMYYRTVAERKKLGQDDIDGVSYLYPVHIDGCGAFGSVFGGTVAMNHKNKDDDDDTNFPFWPMVISLFAMIGIFEAAKILKKSRPLAF
jgi:hypothetical protein